MKIEVKSNKNIFGKHKNYIANFGTWIEEGKTKEEAKTNLLTALEWYFSEPDFMPIVKNANSRIVILNRDFKGYFISAIDKESASEVCTFYGRISLPEARKYLKAHVDNYLR